MRFALGEQFPMAQAGSVTHRFGTDVEQMPRDQAAALNVGVVRVLAGHAVNLRPTLRDDASGNARRAQ
jgi:hypothetical protein